MANQIENNLFEEELSDTDLLNVVGGTAAGLVTGVGTEVGNVGKTAGTAIDGVGTTADSTYGLVRTEVTGQNGALDLYDFLFRG